MYTQEQLMNALQEAGADGRPFTLSAVGAHLGLSSSDKHELDRFRRRVRSLQKASNGAIERVGNSSYRLRANQPLQAAEMIEAQLPSPVTAAANEVTQLRAGAPQAPMVELHAVSQPVAAAAAAPAAAYAAPQPSASEGSWRARGLELGQRLLGRIGQECAQREAHLARLRMLAQQWKPTIEVLRALGMQQLQTLRQRVAGVRAR